MAADEVQPTPAQDESAVAEVRFADAVRSAAPTKVASQLDPDTAATAFESLAASTACRVISTTVRAENAFGTTLFTFRQESTWCYRGSSITFRNSNLIVTSPFPGWSYKGLISQSSSKGTPWIRFRQGEFAQCFPTPWGESCASHTYPWIKHTMRASGGYTIERGIG